MSKKEIEGKKFRVFVSLCCQILRSVELYKRRQKAQEQGDIAEEAKLCNAIGELCSQNGVRVCVRERERFRFIRKSGNHSHIR